MRQACSAHRSRRRARRCSRPPSCTGTARPPHGRAARSRAPRPSCPPLGCRRAARTALTPPSALSAGAQNPGTALCVRVHGPPPTWARQRRLRGSTRDAPRFDLLRVRAVNPHPNAGQTCARARRPSTTWARPRRPGPRRSWWSLASTATPARTRRTAPGAALSRPQVPWVAPHQSVYPNPRRTAPGATLSLPQTHWFAQRESWGYPEPTIL